MIAISRNASNNEQLYVVPMIVVHNGILRFDVQIRRREKPKEAEAASSRRHQSLTGFHFLQLFVFLLGAVIAVLPAGVEHAPEKEKE